MPCAEEMSPSGEQIVDDGMDGQKALGMCPRFETPQLPFALTGGLV